MNYWKKFAELLWLELNESFRLVKPNREKLYNVLYKITEDGLYYKVGKTDGWYDEPSVTLDYILNGDYSVVKLPRKPKKGDEYWYYSKCWKQAIFGTWEGGLFELCLWKVGNCFRTEDEAKNKGKEIMEQIQKEFEEE